MGDLDCVLLPVGLLRPTEETIPARVREVVALILEEDAWTQPICVDSTVHALLDGHHRLAAARALGLVRVPVHIFDYAEVELLSWRANVAPTRAEVLARALSGRVYPHKTTRHVFPPRPARAVSLAALRDPTGPNKPRPTIGPAQALRYRPPGLRDRSDAAAPGCSAPGTSRHVPRGEPVDPSAARAGSSGSTA